MPDPNDHIGEWATRAYPNGYETLGHLVETRVASRFTTECGRQMAFDLKGAKLRFDLDLPLEKRCKRCNNNV